MDNYKNQGYDNEQAAIGVKYSYFEHLNESIQEYKKINRRKGIIYFWIYRFVIIAFIGYICIVPMSVLYQNNNPLKVIIMSDDSKGKKVFNPKDVIKVHPTMEREGFSKKISDFKKSSDTRTFVITSKKREKSSKK